MVRWTIGLGLSGFGGFALGSCIPSNTPLVVTAFAGIGIGCFVRVVFDFLWPPRDFA